MIEYSLFRKFSHLKAFTTTREDFEYTKVRYQGSRNHPGPLKMLSGLLNIPPANMIFPVQCHTSNIAIIKNNSAEGLSDIDALITGEPGLCLCIQTEDCVPVLLYDPVRRVTGAIHAGWRGTLANITANTAQRMATEFSTDPGLWFSARREGTCTGRMVSGIMMLGKF